MFRLTDPVETAAGLIGGAYVDDQVVRERMTAEDFYIEDQAEKAVDGSRERTAVTSAQNTTDAQEAEDFGHENSDD